MSHLMRFLVLAVFAASWVGCGAVGLVGNGNQVTQSRELGAFRKLQVEDGLEISFTVGPRAVAIAADDNLIRHVQTQVRDEALVVWLMRPVVDSRGIKISVSNEALEGVSLSGGSGFVGAATATPTFELEASGASTAELSQIASTAVNVNASGGSKVTLTGTATQLKVAASGGSEVLSLGLVTQAGVVDVSGGSSVCVRCSESISGTASGGSTLTVAGSPPSAEVDSSGGSRLIKAD